MLRHYTHVTFLALAVLLTAACGSAAPGQGSGGAASDSTPQRPAATGVAAPARTAERTGTPGATTKITLGLTYKPDVQFAPFYVAAEKGYYKQEGLDVEFKHLMEADMLKLVGAGQMRYAVASGDEMLIARSQGVPLVYTGAYFHKYPVSLITKKEAGVTQVKDIKGKSVGVPGPFGATYTGLKALLYSAGLTEQDVQVRPIGFTQVQALQRGQADAVMGYQNNEPVQLERLGVPVNTIPVWQQTDLVSNGIITNEQNLAANPEEVGALVRATMRGLQASIDSPEAALEATLKRVPEAGGEQRAASLAVLKASVPLWHSDASDKNGLGYTDPESWEATRDFLKRAGALAKDVDLSKAYTNRFVQR